MTDIIQRGKKKKKNSKVPESQKLEEGKTCSIISSNPAISAALGMTATCYISTIAF